VTSKVSISMRTLRDRLFVAICAPCFALSSCEKTSPAMNATPIQNPTPSPPDAAEKCPPEQLLREVHTTSFHFQHGTVETGRQHLARAQALSEATDDEEIRRVLAQLSAISQRISNEPDWAQSKTEDIRFFFSSWTCIPQEMHDRFHEALPPIPGGR
jgi:hypothetical protein